MTSPVAVAVDNLHGDYGHAHGIGVWFTVNAQGLGQIHVSQSIYVALECTGFIGMVLAGLLTAWLVMP